METKFEVFVTHFGRPADVLTKVDFLTERRRHCRTLWFGVLANERCGFVVAFLV